MFPSLEFSKTYFQERERQSQLCEQIKVLEEECKKSKERCETLSSTAQHYTQLPSTILSLIAWWVIPKTSLHVTFNNMSLVCCNWYRSFFPFYMYPKKCWPQLLFKWSEGPFLATKLFNNDYLLFQTRKKLYIRNCQTLKVAPLDDDHIQSNFIFTDWIIFEQGPLFILTFNGITNSQIIVKSTFSCMSKTEKEEFCERKKLYEVNTPTFSNCKNVSSCFQKNSAFPTLFYWIVRKQEEECTFYCFSYSVPTERIIPTTTLSASIPDEFCIDFFRVNQDYIVVLDAKGRLFLHSLSEGTWVHYLLYVTKTNEWVSVKVIEAAEIGRRHWAVMLDNKKILVYKFPNQLIHIIYTNSIRCGFYFVLSEDFEQLFYICTEKGPVYSRKYPFSSSSSLVKSNKRKEM